MIELRRILEGRMILSTKRPWIKKSTIRYHETGHRIYCNTKAELLRLREILKEKYGVSSYIIFSNCATPEDDDRERKIYPKEIKKLFHLPPYTSYSGTLEIESKSRKCIEKVLEDLSEDWNLVLQINKNYILR